MNKLIKSKKYKEICNPEIYLIGYCIDYTKMICPMTCEFVKEKNNLVKRIIVEDIDF